MTTCAFQLLFGKIYAFFDVKTTFLTSIVIFEAASALCGAAPTSTAFIIGRAIAGVGAAGIFAGSIVCIVQVVPLHTRPKVQGVFGAVFGGASIIGPLIGGALTTHVTWRWVFYLNLPIGGAAMVVIAFLLKIPNRDTTKLPLKRKLQQLDFPGTALFIPGVVSLLVALQWGGQSYDWNSWRIILLLVLASALLLGFAVVQVWMPDTATLAPRIFKQRTVLSSMLATFTFSSANYIFSESQRRLVAFFPNSCSSLLPSDILSVRARSKFSAVRRSIPSNHDPDDRGIHIRWLAEFSSWILHTAGHLRLFYHVRWSWSHHNVLDQHIRR